MKIIKPMRLGVNHRTFEHERSCRLAVSVMVFFGFEAPSRPLQEAHMWRLVSEELADETVFDELMPKHRAEVLVSGYAFPAGGQPAAVCAVRLALGSIDKRLYVIGDRKFVRGQSTEPIAFDKMKLSWTRAFGGEGFARNPLGMGVAAIERDGAKVHPLPNLEDPRRLIKSPSDRPEPVNFGPLEVTWPERTKHAGSYDERWLKQRYPGFPEDFHWAFFSRAPVDQRIEGFFAGGESLLLENMHPEHAKQTTTLPDLKARCFVLPQGSTTDQLLEVPLRIDTVYLFPHRQRGVMIYRGTCEVDEDDAADIELMMVACESPDEPRELAHYQAVLRKRLDKDFGYLHALEDGDLLPPRDPALAPIEHEELVEASAAEHAGLLEANMRAGMDKQLEQGREQLRALGQDPDSLPQQPKPAQPPKLDALAPFVKEQLQIAEQMRAEAERERDAQLARMKKQLIEQGLDPDQVMVGAVGGPPTFRAADEVARLGELATLGRNAGTPLLHIESQLADASLLAKLQKMEQQLVDAYRRFAQEFPAARALAGDETQRLREIVAAAIAAGESLAGRDLTSADLSDMDLSGADLSGAFIEGANLSRSKLVGADLRDAVLTRADLTDAELRGAKLTGANLGGARLLRTDLSGGIDLSGGVLARADIESAKLDGILLNDVDMMDARLTDTSLAGVSATGLMLLGNTLNKVDFSGCRLHSCMFLHTDLSDGNFSDGDVSESVFVAVVADRARFDNANCRNIRVVEQSSFLASSFRNAQLDKANLRDALLDDSDLTEVQAKGADFSGAKLKGACFERAELSEALFVRSDLRAARMAGANLMQASMSKADLRDTDLRGANLFRAELSQVRVSGSTNLAGANKAQLQYRARADE